MPTPYPSKPGPRALPTSRSHALPCKEAWVGRVRAERRLQQTRRAQPGCAPPPTEGLPRTQCKQHRHGCCTQLAQAVTPEARSPSPGEDPVGSSEKGGVRVPQPCDNQLSPLRGLGGGAKDVPQPLRPAVMRFGFLAVPKAECGPPKYSIKSQLTIFSPLPFLVETVFTRTVVNDPEGRGASTQSLENLG